MGPIRSAGLVLDKAGNLYGTTGDGSDLSCGFWAAEPCSSSTLKSGGRTHVKVSNTTPFLLFSGYMISSISYVVLAVAAIPFIYYLIALFSSWQFFRSARHRKRP